MDQGFILVYDDIIVDRDLSWLLKFDDREVWLPKSQCSIDEDEFEVIIPSWLVEENELESFILD